MMAAAYVTAESEDRRGRRLEGEYQKRLHSGSHWCIRRVRPYRQAFEVHAKPRIRRQPRHRRVGTGFEPGTIHLRSDDADDVTSTPVIAAGRSRSKAVASQQVRPMLLDVEGRRLRLIGQVDVRILLDFIADETKYDSHEQACQYTSHTRALHSRVEVPSAL